MKKKSKKFLNNKSNIIIVVLLLIIIFLFWQLQKQKNIDSQININNSNNTEQSCKKATSFIKECKDAILNESGTQKLGYINLYHGEGYYFFNGMFYYCNYNFTTGLNTKITCQCKKMQVDKSSFQALNKNNASDKYNEYQGWKIK